MTTKRKEKTMLIDLSKVVKVKNELPPKKRYPYLAIGTVIIIVSMLILLVVDLASAETLRVKSETIRVVTAYNAGDPRQTDDTPCIAANNKDLCQALDRGEKHCAANFVPLGTKLHIDKLGVYVVTDRTNRRYRNRVDIAMKKSEYKKAMKFGRQKLNVKILK